MSICIEKLNHSCGSSDALQVFQDDEGGFNGYCFACSTYVPNPYSLERAKELREELKGAKPAIDFEALREEVLDYPILAMPERRLRKESFEHFNIHTSVSESDGYTPVIQYYPYTSNGTITGFKARFLPIKKFWCHGSMRNVDLFGWEQAIATGSRRLFITEGELDAVALYQAIKDSQRGTQWEHLEPAVVSLPKGASSAGTVLAALSSKIRTTFAEIVLVFDQDEAGEKATQAAMQVLPEALAVQCPAKDPGDAVEKGKSKALAKAALFRPEKPKNTRLVWGSSLVAEAREPASMGLSWPWKRMTEATRGLRFGETIYLGAGVKMGKSEMVNQLATHLMLEHNMKVFLAKPEEANKKTIKMIAGKVAGKFFHDPNIPFDYEAYDAACRSFQDRLLLLNIYQHMGWQTLRADILEAISLGCKAIFIDPITNLINGVPSAEANTVLQGFAQDLSAISLDHEIMTFIFCHLKAPDSGPPHERGGEVMSHQFAGSRAMMRSCNMMLGLEGNKDPNLPVEQRNMRELVILEDREFGVSDRIKLYWDHKTGLFNEAV